MLVVVVIVGLMLVLAFPYVHGIIRRGRLQNAASMFGTGLLKARLQAVKRGNNVGLSVTNDTSNPDHGYLVLFVDRNNDGVYNAADTILQVMPMPPDADTKFLAVSIDAPDQNSPSSSPATFAFVFTPFGSAINALPSGAVSKAVYLSDNRGNVLEVGVPMAASGKVSTRKRNTETNGTGTYVLPPWKWY